MKTHRIGPVPLHLYSLPLVMLLLAPVLAAAQGTAGLERLFYYTDSEAAWNSLSQHIDQVSRISSTGYFIDADGVVWGEVDPRVIELGRQHRVPVMPLLANPGFNQELLHSFLTDDDARGRAIAALVELCAQNQYDGFQIDFENVSIEDRDALSQFFREAAAALHAAGRHISIAVVHRPGELAGPTRYHGWMLRNWRGGYDLKALADAGDFITVMTYSQHTRRTPPGPEAGIPWVTDVIDYFLRFMPPEKLSMGVPVLGQHWYTSQEDRITPELARSYSEAVSYQRARALIDRYHGTLAWNEEQQVPYGYYERGGTFEWIFFENARSFTAKLNLARQRHLRGISVWVLGREDPADWDVLGNPTR